MNDRYAVVMSDRDAVFTPIRAGVLSAEVSAQIRARILDGSLQPGQVIKDSLLAESLGLSRSPVREALRMLEERGLVQKTPNRSYTVVSFSPRDVEELAALRVAYESAAVRWIVEHRLDTTALLEPLDAMVPADDSAEEKARVVDADGWFHRRLIEMTGLPRLTSSYGAIRDQIRLMLSSGYLMRTPFIRTQRERHEHLHRLLIEAVASGDPATVLNELEFHVRAGMGLLDDPEVGPAADA